MRLRKDTRNDLYTTIFESCVEEIQEVSSGNCVERLTEIISEDYQSWPDEKCQKVAQQFFDENYDKAYKEAQESFEPTAQGEAQAGIQRETMAALAARGW